MDHPTVREQFYRLFATSTADASTSSLLAPFTCIWTIKNFSDLTYIDLKSPSFVAKSIGDTVWHLHIDEYAGFFCSINTEGSVEDKSKGIDFEFSFLGADGKPLISKRSNEPRLVLTLMSRADFLERWAEFIPNNTLTVQCRMWRRDREISDVDMCYVVTKPKMYKGSFVWAVKEFGALNSTDTDDFREVARAERKVYPLNPLTQSGPFMSLVLYLKKNSESDDVHVCFLIEKGRDYAYSCELSVLDANGKVIASNVDRGRLSYSWETLILWPLISKNKLISNKNLFLPNDTLLLKCSFEVCTGVISNEIEYLTSKVSSVVEEEEEILDFHVASEEADVSLQFEEYFVKEMDENGLSDNFVEERK